PFIASAREIAAALGIPSTALAVSLLYLQLCHYVVWLWTLPRGSARLWTPQALGAAILAVATSAALMLFAPRLGGVRAVRTSYLAIAAFHVVGELVALADAVRRRGSERAWGAISPDAKESIA